MKPLHTSPLSRPLTNVFIHHQKDNDTCNNTNSIFNLASELSFLAIKTLTPLTTADSLTSLTTPTTSFQSNLPSLPSIKKIRSELLYPSSESLMGPELHCLLQLQKLPIIEEKVKRLISKISEEEIKKILFKSTNNKPYPKPYPKKKPQAIQVEPEEITTLWQLNKGLCAIFFEHLHEAVKNLHYEALIKMPLFLLLCSKQAANDNSAVAQYYLGVKYYFGTELHNYHNKDLKKSFDFFQKSASQLFTPAQTCLATFYQDGIITKKNLRKAFNLHQLAAKKGFSGAQNNLGTCYKNNNQTPNNQVTASKLFRLAANQGLAPAQNNLGFCYSTGQGVKRNRDKAFKWYKLAADQDLAIAKQKLNLLPKSFL